MGTPIEVTEAFPFGESESGGPLVGKVNEFGTVDLVVTGCVAEIVGPAREGGEFPTQGFGTVGGQGGRAVDLNPGTPTPDDPVEVGCPANVAEGLDDVPLSIALHEDAAVGPGTAGDALDGIDEGAAGQGLEDDIALVFLRGKGEGDAIDSGDGSRSDEDEEQGSEPDPGGDGPRKDVETGKHVHGDLRCSEAWTGPPAMRHGTTRRVDSQTTP